MTTLALVLHVALAALTAAIALGHIAHPPHRTRKAAMPAPLRRLLNRLHRTANDDPQRSPDWCWTHGCHRSACPTPQH